MQLRRTSWSTASRPSPIGLSWCPIAVDQGQREERRLWRGAPMVRHVPAQQTHWQAGLRRARVLVRTSVPSSQPCAPNAPGAARLAHHAGSASRRAARCSRNRPAPAPHRGRPYAPVMINPLHDALGVSLRRAPCVLGYATGNVVQNICVIVQNIYYVSAGRLSRTCLI